MVLRKRGLPSGAFAESDYDNPRPDSTASNGGVAAEYFESVPVPPARALLSPDDIPEVGGWCGGWAVWWVGGGGDWVFI